MKNYFKTFSIPIDFNVDLEIMDSIYLKFQKQFHPDNADLADIEKSILLNAAYETLTKPIRRASHILQLNGIDLEDDSKAPKPDMSTLEEILELQEEVSEIESSNNIPELKTKLEGEISKIMQIVVLDLNNKNFDQAAQNLMKVKYFDKTLKDLKAKKRSLNN